MNLTPMMCRLTRTARKDKLRLTLYVAPGRAEDLRTQLRGRDVLGWVHSDTTVRVEDPLSILEFYLRTGIMAGAEPVLRRYVALRALLRPGLKRDPVVFEELEQLTARILEIQGD